MGEDGGEDGGDGDAEGAEAQDGDAGFAEFRELEGEAALEEDDGDEEADDGEEDLLVEVVVDGDVGGGGEAEAEGEEEKDGRELQAPGDQLGEDAEAEDEDEIGEGRHRATLYGIGGLENHEKRDENFWWEQGGCGGAASRVWRGGSPDFLDAWRGCS